MNRVDYSCPMCGVVFLLKARFDAHREAEIPAFAGAAELMRQASNARWLSRQVESGRMTPDGQWVKDWRP